MLGLQRGESVRAADPTTANAARGGKQEGSRKGKMEEGEKGKFLGPNGPSYNRPTPTGDTVLVKPNLETDF